MKVDPPSAEQKKWREDVRLLGSIVSVKNAVIHHMYGRTARFNKIDIGHWAILPLSPEEHVQFHAGKKSFESLNGSQKELFRTVCGLYRRRYDRDLPFDENVYEAIMEYRR
jgi:hypothetical protein